MSAVASTVRPSGVASAPIVRGPDRRLDVAVVVAPAVLAAVLCVISLTGRGLGFDEGATVAIASGHGAALWRGIAHDGGNMSGYYLLVHVLIGAFGDGPVVLRLPSVVAAALTPGLVAATGLVLFDDRRAAGLAGLLSAMSVPLVYWGQTTRGYAPMLCLACAGMLCFAAAVRATRDGAARSWPWWVAYVVVTAAAAYCAFIVVLVVVPQALWLLRGPRAAIARFAGAIAGVVVLCVPIAVLAARRGSGQLFWVARPNGQTDSYVMQELTGSGFQSTFHRAFSTTPGWILISVVLIVILALTARGALRSSGMALALLWLIVPGLVEFVGSYVVQPVFLPRNVLVSVPAVALVLGAALADRRLPRWSALGGIGLVLLIRAVPVASSYGAAPEPWREVTARVLAAARPGDCVAFYPEDGRNAFRYYVARAGREATAPRAVLPDAPWTSTRPFVELYPTLAGRRIAALRGGCRRIWLVSSHEGQPSGPPVSRAHLRRYDRLRARLARAYSPAPTTTYGWASAIHVILFTGAGRGGRR